MRPTGETPPGGQVEGNSGKQNERGEGGGKKKKKVEILFPAARLGFRTVCWQQVHKKQKEKKNNQSKKTNKQ